MSFVESAREQLLRRTDIDATTIEAADLNAIILNNRAVNASTINTTVSANITRQSADANTRVDKTVNPVLRVSNPPDPDYKLPVLYGRATFGGALIDVAQVGTTSEFQFVYALSMITGGDIAGNPVEYEFLDCFVNDQKINFQSNGSLAASVTDTSGNTNTDFNNKIGVYLFTNSANMVLPNGFETTGTTYDARNIFPTWGPDNQMQGIIFAIVRIIYDPDIGFDAVPDMRFDIRNSITLPGDVLYDYLRNSAYGCGIADDNIRITSL